MNTEAALRELAEKDMNQQCRQFYLVLSDLAEAFTKKSGDANEDVHTGRIRDMSLRGILQKWSSFTEMFFEHKYSEDELLPLFRILGERMRETAIPDKWDMEPYAMAFMDFFLDQALIGMVHHQRLSASVDKIMAAFCHPDVFFTDRTLAKSGLRRFAKY